MRSLRGRLMAGTVLGGVMVFSVAGIGLYVLIRASLYAEFDGALTAKAGLLASLVELDDGRVEMELENAALPEFSRLDQPEYFELWTATGEVLIRSRSLDEANLDAPGISAEGARVVRPAVLPDGRPGRVVAICFCPRGAEEEEHRGGRAAPAAPLALALAAETTHLTATLSRIRLILLGVCAASALAVASVLAGVVHVVLRPLGDLAGRIAAVGTTNLATRIDVAGAPAELDPVIGRLNELLARLQAAFAREKCFTSDVAHELRTPLAGLRSTLDVCLSRAREPEAYRAAFADSLNIVRQMQALVENLLALARLESGAVVVEATPVRLHELIAECWKPYADLARQRSLRVVANLDQAVTVETDRERLRHVLANVFENAVTYADTGGEVHIELQRADGQARIRISNTGCTLSPADAERVFERFWRGDAARHDIGVHCGLGLPLSKRLMEALGGSIRAACPADGTFAATISLAENRGQQNPQDHDGE